MGAYVDKVDGTNPLVTGSLAYGFGGTPQTTTVTVNKVEPDGVNHRFDITLNGADGGVTTAWTVATVKMDGAPAPAGVTVTSAGTYTITDATGAVATNNLTATLAVTPGNATLKNAVAETQTFDFSPVGSTLATSSVAVNVAGPTAALTFNAAGKILAGSNMSVAVAANSMYVGNLVVSGLEPNAAQQFHFDLSQVTNTAAATTVAGPTVGSATLPGGGSIFANVVYTGGSVTNPGSLTSGSPQTFSVAANAFDDGNTAQTITLDFSKITNSSNATGLIGPLAGTAGNSAGSLKDFTVDQTGVIHGVYTNGFTQTIGQILLASFENPSGLQREGSNLLQISADSGVVNVGTAGSGKLGTIASGNIETSNVDLAAEFSNMILAERGFQANSKMVTTADTMLSDLLQLKQTP